jgi:hypothetical protein
MDIAALAAGAFGLVVLGRMLFLGSAAPNGESFRRDEEPAVYLTIVAVGCAAVCGLFYIGLFDPFRS